MPNSVGLPGFSATPQKRSSTPSSASAARTWSCSPTDTPPQSTSTSARSSAAAIASRVASASSPTRRRSRDDLGAAPLGERADGVGVGVVDRAGARAAVPGSSSSSPVVITATRGRRAQRELGASERGEHAELGGAERGARRRARASPGADVLAGEAHVGPAVGGGEDLDAPVLAPRLLDGRRRRRRRRAWSRRSRWRPPRRWPSGARGGAPGARLADDAQLDRPLGAGVAHVEAAQREAVHRGVVEAGHGAVAAHVLGEHAPERVRRARRARSASACTQPSTVRRASSSSIRRRRHAPERSPTQPGVS